MFPVDHDGGFRRIPALSNSTESVYKPERLKGISNNLYTISEELVSVMMISMNRQILDLTVVDQSVL